MFTNTVTGESIKDGDYKHYYTVNTRNAARAAREAAEKADAIEDRAEVAERLANIEEELNGADVSAFAAWVDNMRGLEDLGDLVGNISDATLDDMVESFCDAFAGTWDSEKAYTENGIEEGLFGEGADGTLGNYIDVDSLTRDLFMSDMWSAPAPGYETHCFYNL